MCLTCTEALNTDCQSCKNVTVEGVTTIYYKHIGANKCDSTCPNGQFVDTAIPNVCQICSP